MRLTVVWRQDSLGTERPLSKLITVAQVRTAGAWTGVVAVKMERVIQETFLR